MATIGNDANGRKRILFVDGDGSRKTIRLGKATDEQALAFKWRVESLIAAQSSGHLDEDVTKWLGKLKDKMYERLVAVGLARPRVAAKAGVGAFIDAYIAGRLDLKPRTVTNLKQLRKWVVDYFGETRDIRTIGPGDAEDFRQHMIKGGLGDNTIRRKIGRARQLFRDAIRRGVVRGANPFEGMAAAVRADKSRQFYVTREAVGKVLDQCPDAQWRLLVSLSRYGGLRCPSEHLALRWGDIDWERNRIRVPSPKTEHHEGKECRYIPLFPELRKPLLETFGETPEGSEWVITRYRDSSTNLRTHFTRLIRKAGLEPWPKLWHNLRSSRQTELAERYPIHVVCAWLGNSRAVAQEHYLQVTDAHFEQAVADPKEAKGGNGKAAQNQAQCREEQNGMVGEEVAVGGEKGPFVPDNSTEFPSVPLDKYPHQDSNLRPPV